MRDGMREALTAQLRARSYSNVGAVTEIHGDDGPHRAA